MRYTPWGGLLLNWNYDEQNSDLIHRNICSDCFLLTKMTLITSWATSVILFNDYWRHWIYMITLLNWFFVVHTKKQGHEYIVRKTLCPSSTHSWDTGWIIYLTTMADYIKPKTIWASMLHLLYPFSVDPLYQLKTDNKFQRIFESYILEQFKKNSSNPCKIHCHVIDRMAALLINI